MVVAVAVVMVAVGMMERAYLGILRNFQLGMRTPFHPFG
jgi:hypothetical protein